MKKLYRVGQMKAMVMACLCGGAAIMLVVFTVALVTEPAGITATFVPIQEQMQQLEVGPEKWLMLAASAAVLFLALGVAFYFIPLVLVALLGRRLGVNHPLFYGVATMAITLVGLLAQIEAGLIEPVGGISTHYFAFHALPPVLAGLVYWYYGVRSKKPGLTLMH